jgi:uncharacterized protein (TIGR01777 family)
MKKVILITGANGMLAQHLGKCLAPDYALRFLTRQVMQSNEYLWNIEQRYIDPKALTGVHGIIHLAGSPIANRRWTKRTKQAILSSRVTSAQLILNELIKQNQRIDSFISASATGFYGTISSNAILTEDSPRGNDFLSDVCQQWEEVAHAFKTKTIANNVSIVRLGVILSKDDGILNKLVPLIKYGLGSGIGTGKQFIPWIHIEDLSNIFKFLLVNSELSGTYNAVSPEHATNKMLMKKIAKQLNRKIILPNIPEIVLRWVFGEAVVVLTKGSRVSSNKLIQRGFIFKFKDLDSALKTIL